jgi:hypothetical protein
MNGSLFRINISIFGLLLGAISLWIILPELSSPNITTLPVSPEQAAAAASRRGEALWAARAALVRGDLWAESAFTYADLEWAGSTQGDEQSLDQATASAIKAVSLKPGTSAVWLMLADLSSRYRWQAPSPTECLKMSYYTGPHEDRLIPLRLMIIAARLDLSADADLADLFRRELETAIMDRTALRPAVVAAYQQATPQAQHMIEEVATRADQAFSQTLRPEIRH